MIPVTVDGAGHGVVLGEDERLVDAYWYRGQLCVDFWETYSHWLDATLQTKVFTDKDFDKAVRWVRGHSGVDLSPAFIRWIVEHLDGAPMSRPAVRHASVTRRARKAL